MNLFKDKHFRRLIIGSVTSNMGSNMQQFALSLYVLAQTGSATAFASIIAISILPRLLLSPIAGVFGDWFDRKKSIVILDFLNAIVIAGFGAFILLYGSLPLVGVYLMVIYLEITELFFGSSMSAVVPSMVSKENLYDANRIKSTLSTIASIASPLLASILYGMMGLEILIFINAFSFLISALSECTITIPKTNVTPDKINWAQFKKDFIDGVQLVKNNRVLKKIIWLGVYLNFSIGAFFSVGLVYILKNVLSVSDVQFGIVMTLLSVSMIAGPILLGTWVKKIHLGKFIVNAFAFNGLLLLGISGVVIPNILTQFQNTTLPLLIIVSLTFIIGMITAVANISVSTFFVTVVPESHLGRVGTFMNLALTVSMPLGQMLFGIGTDLLPSYVMVLTTAFIVIFVSIGNYKAFANLSFNTETQSS